MGDQNGVHVGEVDYIIEVDDLPAAELSHAPIDEVDRAVSALDCHDADREGSCLQIGIGACLNAVCRRFLESGVRVLGVLRNAGGRHADLYRSGPSPARGKLLDRGQDRLTFRLVRAPSYACSNAPRLRVSSRRLTISAHIIMRNDRIISNQQYDADLPASQASSSVRRHRQPQRTRAGAFVPLLRIARAILHVPVHPTYDSDARSRSPHPPPPPHVCALTPGNVVHRTTLFPTALRRDGIGMVT